VPRPILPRRLLNTCFHVRFHVGPSLSSCTKGLHSPRVRSAFTINPVRARLRGAVVRTVQRCSLSSLVLLSTLSTQGHRKYLHPLALRLDSIALRLNLFASSRLRVSDVFLSTSPSAPASGDILLCGSACADRLTTQEEFERKSQRQCQHRRLHRLLRAVVLLEVPSRPAVRSRSILQTPPSSSQLKSTLPNAPCAISVTMTTR
jgi:hypothetical protein